jgi:hypothetical protein
MNGFDKNWLIEQVNQNPGSPYFPVLSHLHLKDKELPLAVHVCKTGLLTSPESIEGNFIMAQIHILNSDIQEAEKVLKFVVNRHTAHVNAWKLLFRIQKDLKRSKSIIKSTVTSLLKIKPNDNECSNWLQNLVKVNPQLTEEQIIEKVQKKEVKIEPQIITMSEEIVPISMRMATFTLAEVYQNQGYFHQAIEVLKIVEKKGGNKRRLKNMRNQIDEAIKAQIEEDSN